MGTFFKLIRYEKKNHTDFHHKRKANIRYNYASSKQQTVTTFSRLTRCQW